MGVEPVNVPLAGKTVATGAQIGQAVNTDKYWQNKAQEARAMREYEEEQQNIKNLRNPPQAGEPPIKMTGEISMGKIDFQEQTRLAREEAAAAREAAEARATKMEEENARLKESLLTTTINNLQQTLGSQITKLQGDIAAGRGNSKSIADQLKEVIDSASLLGFVKPEAARPTPVVANATDAAISLEMLRLQLEDKRADRNFAWQMEKDRREFQIQLKKLDQANRLAAQEISVKREQSAWLAKAPEMIGNTIAQGLMASRGGGTIESRPTARRTAQNPYAPPHTENIESQAPNSEPGRKVAAGINEAGTIDCPDCQQPIAIGPTATRAICAACGYEVEIVRNGGGDER